MPTVPRYNQETVKSTAVPSIKPAPAPDLDAFGGGDSRAAVDRSVQRFANTIDKIAAEEKHKADQLAVLEADKELSALETALQYDPKSGFMNRKGKDAMGIPDHAKKEWDGRVAKIGERMRNPDQRMAFKRQSESRWSSLDNNIQRYVMGEIRQYDQQETEAYIATERDAAAINYLDPQRIGMSIQRQQAAIYQHAERNGMPPEWIKLKITDATSKTHVNVIERMLANGQDQTARLYYETTEPFMSGDDRMGVEKALEEGSLRGESQRQADSIMDRAGSRMRALEETKRIEDPKLRDLTRDRINQEFSNRETAKSELRNEFYMTAANIIDQRKPKNVGEARQLIPPGMWMAMTPEQRDSIERRVTNPTNDDAAWLEFIDKSPEDIQSLSRSDFETRYWSKFDQAHRTRAENMWNPAADGLTSLATLKPWVDSTLRALQVIPAGKTLSEMNNSQRATYAQFEQAAAKAVEQFEKVDLEQKRKATGQEVQKIVEDLATTEVFIKKRWAVDPEKPVAILTDEERGAAYVPIEEIPEEDIAAMTTWLRPRGRVTKDKIQRLYAAYKAQDRALMATIAAEK